MAPSVASSSSRYPLRESSSRGSSYIFPDSDEPALRSASNRDIPEDMLEMADSLVVWGQRWFLNPVPALPDTGMERGTLVLQSGEYRREQEPQGEAESIPLFPAPGSPSSLPDIPLTPLSDRGHIPTNALPPSSPGCGWPFDLQPNSYHHSQPPENHSYHSYHSSPEVSTIPLQPQQEASSYMGRFQHQPMYYFVQRSASSPPEVTNSQHQNPFFNQNSQYDYWSANAAASTSVPQLEPLMDEPLHSFSQLEQDIPQNYIGGGMASQNYSTLMFNM